MPGSKMQTSSHRHRDPGSVCFLCMKALSSPGWPPISGECRGNCVMNGAIRSLHPEPVMLSLENTCVVGSHVLGYKVA